MELADLLIRATVRIDIGGIPSGTGFFVSPRSVITCAHVIEPALLSSSDAPTRIEVVEFSGTRHVIRVPPKVDKFTDLAWVSLSSALPEVAVAVLHGDIRLSDELYSYGFPEKYPDGVPTTFEAEGLSGGSPARVKFKEGNVQPGMSGSPILNLRSGAVCAVMKRTRDKASALGGYGLTVEALEQSSFYADLAATLKAGSTGLATWLGMLSPAQAVTLRPFAERSPGPSEELVIEVGQREDGWTVQALDTGAAHSGLVRVDLNVVRRQVAQLFRAWRSHDRIDDAEQAQLVGQVLYGALFPAPISETLESCLFDGTAGRLNICLRFAPGTDPDLAQLPWEQVYYPGDGDERGGKALATTERLTITRVLSPQPQEPVVPESSTLSVLLLHAFGGAEPQKSPAMQTVAEVKSALGANSCVKLEDCNALTGEELADRLSRSHYDVLHYLGSGRYLSTTDALAILNEDDDETGWLTPRELVTLLGEHPPSLVILQACKQAQAVVPGDLTVFAPHLLRAGVANVVAWQSAVEDPDMATKMMKAFYDSLCSGRAVREAVRAARLRTKLSPWYLPAHFARGPGDVRMVAAAGAPPARWGAGVGHV